MKKKKNKFQLKDLVTNKFVRLVLIDFNDIGDVSRVLFRPDLKTPFNETQRMYGEDLALFLNGKQLF